MSDHDDAARYAAAPASCSSNCARRADDDDSPAGRSATRATCSRTATSSSSCATEHPDDRDPVGGVGRRPAAPRRRPGLDHRPARRHPRVHRDRPHRLGRPRRAVGARAAVATAAAVALPALGDRAVDGHAARGAGIDGRRPRIVVSRSRAPAAARRVAEALDGELVYLGSAGAKTMAVVLGEVDAYVHAGGQYEWDSAAPTRGRRRRGSLHVAPRRLARSSTTGPIRGSPTSSCAGPSSPTTSWRPPPHTDPTHDRRASTRGRPMDHVTITTVRRRPTLGAHVEAGRHAPRRTSSSSTGSRASTADQKVLAVAGGAHRRGLRRVRVRLARPRPVRAATPRWATSSATTSPPRSTPSGRRHERAGRRRRRVDGRDRRAPLRRGPARPPRPVAGVVTVSCPAHWRLPRNARGVLSAVMTQTPLRAGASRCAGWACASRHRSRRGDATVELVAAGARAARDRARPRRPVHPADRRRGAVRGVERAAPPRARRRARPRVRPGRRRGARRSSPPSTGSSPPNAAPTPDRSDIRVAGHANSRSSEQTPGRGRVRRRPTTRRGRRGRGRCGRPSPGRTRRRTTSSGANCSLDPLEQVGRAVSSASACSATTCSCAPVDAGPAHQPDDPVGRGVGAQRRAQPAHLAAAELEQRVDPEPPARPPGDARDPPAPHEMVEVRQRRDEPDPLDHRRARRLDLVERRTRAAPPRPPRARRAPRHPPRSRCRRRAPARRRPGPRPAPTGTSRSSTPRW